MKVREVKKFVKEELNRGCWIDAKYKWRRHTGMLEMYMKERGHNDWHEVISIDLDHVKSARYSDNLLKSNLKRSIEAIKRRNMKPHAHRKTTKTHKK